MLCSALTTVPTCCAALALPHVVQPWPYYIFCAALVLPRWSYLFIWRHGRLTNSTKELRKLVHSNPHKFLFLPAFYRVEPDPSLVVNTCDQEIVSRLESGSPCHWKWAWVQLQVCWRTWLDSRQCPIAQYPCAIGWRIVCLKIISSLWVLAWNEPMLRGSAKTASFITNLDLTRNARQAANLLLGWGFALSCMVL